MCSVVIYSKVHGFMLFQTWQSYISVYILVKMLCNLEAVSKAPMHDNVKWVSMCVPFDSKFCKIITNGQCQNIGTSYGSSIDQSRLAATCTLLCYSIIFEVILIVTSLIDMIFFCYFYYCYFWCSSTFNSPQLELTQSLLLVFQLRSSKLD